MLAKRNSSTPCWGVASVLLHLNVAQHFSHYKRLWWPIFGHCAVAFLAPLNLCLKVQGTHVYYFVLMEGLHYGYHQVRGCIITAVRIVCVCCHVPG